MWADIVISGHRDRHAVLRNNHTQEDLEAFLGKLEFEDDDYNSLLCEGSIVMLSDGSWLKRYIDDWGSDWAEISVPEMPEVCR